MRRRRRPAPQIKSRTPAQSPKPPVASGARSVLAGAGASPYGPRPWRGCVSTRHEASRTPAAATTRWGEPLAPLRRRRFRAIPIRVVLPQPRDAGGAEHGADLHPLRHRGQVRDGGGRGQSSPRCSTGSTGRLARALRGTSRFGAELDSLADFVDFGVAPALILYFSSLNRIPSFGWFAALIFVIAAALRLARFNTHARGSRPAGVARQLLHRHAGTGGRHRRPAAALRAALLFRRAPARGCRSASTSAS